MICGIGLINRVMKFQICDNKPPTLHQTDGKTNGRTNRQTDRHCSGNPLCMHEALERQND